MNEATRELMELAYMWGFEDSNLNDAEGAPNQDDFEDYEEYELAFDQYVHDYFYDHLDYLVQLALGGA